MEQLEPRRLLAATTRDLFTIASQTVAYDSGGILYQQTANTPEADLEGRPIIDLSEDSPADQVYRLTTATPPAKTEFDPLGERANVEQWIHVDPAESYRFEATTFHVPEQVAFDLAYAGYDADGLRVAPIHVNKIPGATDTTLVQAINPDDTYIVVADASGWSNELSSTARTRALAWYGYQDASGVVHDDFTYTRNVLGDKITGAWPAEGIEYDATLGGYRITLTEPWSLAGVPVGTAVRNALGDHGLLDLPQQTFNRAIREHIWRPWPRYEKLETWSDFGGRRWDAELRQQPAVPPVVSWMRLSTSLPIYNPTVRPNGDETADAPTFATFNGNSRYVASRSLELVASDLPVTIDTTNSYTLSAFAGVHVTDQVPEPTEMHSIGYNAYDVDGKIIRPEHVRKYSGAVDTTLFADVLPGDQQIVLEDATGWSNADLDPASRTLAWYGYADDRGGSYPDYTYTRNISGDPAFGLWSAGGVVDNRLILNRPWDGPALSAGTAVRNAVAGDPLHPVLLDNGELTVAGQRLASQPITGTWQAGSPDLTAFPPGTASIRPAADLNRSSLTEDDVVTLESFAVSQTAETIVAPDPQSHRYRIALDVMANDDVASDPSIELVAVSSPKFGDATISPDGRIIYHSEAWFVGTDHFEYTLRDPSSGTQWAETVTVTILGTNVDQDPSLVQSLSENASNQPIARDPVANDDDHEHWGNFGAVIYRVLTQDTLVADGYRQQSLLAHDGEFGLGIDDAAAVSLVRKPVHGSLNLKEDGTFTYVSDPGFVGFDSFQYAVFDGLRTDTAVAVIEVFADETELVLKNLHTLALAMHDYHSRYRGLPVNDAPGNRDEDGIPHLGWRVHLLPFLGYEDFFDEFRLDEPWDSPHNLPLADKMPDVFGDGLGASDPQTRIQTMTSNHRVPHPGSGPVGFPEDGSVLGLWSVRDGLHNTIMLVRTGADRAVPWTSPVDAPFNYEQPLNTLGQIESSGIPVAMFDGTTGVLPPGIDGGLFESLATRDSSPPGPIADAGAVFRQAIDDGVWTPPFGTWDAGGERQDINLLQIGLGLKNYHSSRREFPPDNSAYGRDENGHFQLSWRVYLLPYIGYDQLWRRFEIEEPWDSPHNLPLLDEMPDIFRSTGDPADSNTTRFRTLRGDGAAYDYDADGSDRSPKARDLTDGPGNTLLVVEAGPDKAVPWTKPDEIEFDRNDPLAALGNLDGEFFRALLADGLQIKLPSDIDPETFVALATRAGAEPISAYSLRRKYSEFNGTFSQYDQRNDFKRVALAFHNYHSAFKRLPVSDASMLDAEGRPWLSWRVHLLPFMDQLPLWEQFHHDEPWDSPHNLSLLPLMPDIYRSVGDDWDSVLTRIQTFVDGGTEELGFTDGAPFHSTGIAPRWREFLDGLSGTILFVEAGQDQRVPWTKPDDIFFDIDDPYGPLGDLGEGFHVAMADGAVEWEESNRDPNRLAYLIGATDRTRLDFRSQAIPRRTEILESSGLGKFDVRIINQAQDRIDSQIDETIDIIVDDPSVLTVFPSSLSFDDDNWELNQSVTFQAVDNEIVDGPRATTVTIGDQSFEIVVIDDDGLPEAFDLGDAPAPYPTLRADDAARHTPTGPRLGDLRDQELDGQPSIDADGDGDDEDGVMFGVIFVGNPLAGVNIDLQNAAEARVDAWLDFDGNGIWDAGDQILDNVPVVAGLQTLNFSVPTDAVTGQTFARVRLSNSGDLQPTGYAADGEVEDDRVEILSVFPSVAEVLINGGDAQRSSLTDVIVIFDREVTAPPSAFTITDRDSGQVVDSVDVVSLPLQGQTRSLLTFHPGDLVDSGGGPGLHTLVDGNYQLVIDASQIAAVVGGPNMVDDFVFGETPVDTFFRRFGDQNGNGLVDLLDFAEFRRTFGKSRGQDGFLEEFNSDADGWIGLTDFAAFRRNFGT